MKEKIIIALIFSISFSCFGQKEKLDSLLDLLQDSSMAGNAKLLNEVSFAFEYIDLEKSLEYAKKAKSSAKKTGNIKELALAYRNIGNYYNSKFNIDEARTYYDSSLGYYKSLDDLSGQAGIINLLGILFGKSNQYDSAFMKFSQAYEIAKPLQDSILLTMIYTNFGLVYFHWGDYEQAMKYYEQSLEINKALNLNEGLEKNYYNLGKIANEWDKPRLALDYFQKATAILHADDNEKAISNVYIDIGNSYNKLDLNDSALYYYNLANNLSKKYNLLRQESIILGNIGNHYRNSGDFKVAFDYYQKAYNLIKHTKDKKRKSQNLQAIGDLYIQMEQYDSAYVWLTKALRLTEELNYLEQKSTCYLNLYKLFKKKKDFDTANEYYLKYSHVKDSLYNKNSQRQFAKFEARYNSEKQASKIHVLEKEKEIKDLELKRQELQIKFLIIFAILILIVGLLLFNRNKLRQKNEMHRMELHYQAVEQRLLRAQMNPHFIFNSLNAIQSFIGENNPEIASRFLAKFGNLIRYNLESTRSAFVPLEQEIAALKNNLDLEKIRFNDRFDYTFTIDPDIDPKQLYVPPLLIQPFIENAILHGLANKPKKGLITIDFNKGINSVKATITDNGIGRKKAEEEKKLKPKEKKSLGTQLIKERLKLFHRQGYHNATLDIIDLHDDKGEPTGTQVVLLIPFELNF